jgi:hypothetical protein
MYSIMRGMEKEIVKGERVRAQTPEQNEKNKLILIEKSHLTDSNLRYLCEK